MRYEKLACLVIFKPQVTALAERWWDTNDQNIQLLQIKKKLQFF